MARTSWTQPFVDFFKKKAPAVSPESCLEFSRQYLEEVRMSKSSDVINYEQCKYLVDSLDKAVQQASLFLEKNLLHGGNSVSIEDMRESTLELFKILCMLAKKVQCFIQGCCNGHWLQAAVMLTNLSDCTASLGLDLKLITILLPPYSDSRRYSSSPLTIDEVDEVAALRYAECERVKEMASNDEDRLVTKLRALIQFGQASNDDLELAISLLDRIDRFKQNLGLITPGSSDLILHERDLMNLKHMVQIGRGGYGTVYKASWLGIDVAAKAFYGTHNPVFKKEVQILASLSHPNIVSFLCHGTDIGKCFIVMELMDQDLLSLIEERLRNDRTRSSPFFPFEEFDVMLQIAEAMNYLHEMRVLHRDLKSANILVHCMKSTNAQGYEAVQVKVSDFGLSRTKEFSMTQSLMTPNMGTTKWMAPELMKYWNTNDIHAMETARDEELVENYPFKCDVYSFGMVCLEILTGAVPFPNMTANEVKRAVCAGQRPQLPDRCHEKLKALIVKCWNPEPRSRPCFGDICMELRYLKSLHMTPPRLPVLQSLQNPASQLESFEEMKKRKRKVKTASSNPELDLRLGPSLRHASTSGNLSSLRPVSSFNPNLGDNSTPGRPTPASESQKTWITTEIRAFTIVELQSLTSNFAYINLLGRDYWSVVYKGLLADYGKVVVKRMVNAVTTLGIETDIRYEGAGRISLAGWISLRDRHLVKMLGYCIDGKDLLLVNEYMSQGTLPQHLFCMESDKSLSWTRRLRIAMDVAQALEYLHGFDLIFLLPFLMSSHVLLDDDLNAKVLGFGLAKPNAEGNLPHCAGYEASEYMGVGRTKAVHVYSFGVVLMELLTGRPAMDYLVDFVTWFSEEVWTKLESVSLQAVLDPHLFLGLNSQSDDPMMVESILVVAKLAMDCTVDSPKARPDMNHAVSVLRCLLNEEERPSERAGLRRVSE